MVPPLPNAMHRPQAVGVALVININNNQMEDGVDIRGCIREEVRPGRNVWGGQLPIIWGGILIDE